MATTAGDHLLPSTPTITQPIQVGQINASFPVNQVQTFEVWLASHVKADDLLIIISNPVIGQIDHRIDWLHNSADSKSFANNNNTQKNLEPSKCRVSFQAPIVGLYTINVEILQPQKFCVQFQAKAYDLGKVFIQNSSGKCRLNESYEFGVDASEAGEGQLEIAVNEGEIPNQVQVLDNGKCIVNFVPEENIPHVVDIKFNGQNVNGCPFVVEIDRHDNGVSNNDVPNETNHQSSQRTPNNEVPNKLGKPILKTEDRVLVNARAVFSLMNVQLTRAEINDIIVVDPENQTIDYKLNQDDQAGRYEFEFTPTVVGDYNVDIQPDSNLLNKLPSNITEQFPFSIKVFDFNEVLVTDVTDGVVGHPIYFFIDATKAGSGNLEIKISSTTRNVPNYPSSEANAKIRVNFTPIEAVNHTIDVKFNGIPVPNNPFTVKVAQFPQARLPITSQDALKYVAINESVRFNVEFIGQKSVLTHITVDSCRVYVLEPDFVYTRLKTVELLPIDKSSSHKQQPQCSFGVEFTPTKIGPHKLFVVVNNELVPGSPVTSNVYNLKEVRVFFEKTANEKNSTKPVGKVNEPVTFTVDASRAGEGTLALAVISSVSKNPVQTDVKVSEKGHGLYNLTFVPIEFAPHSIDMSFNDRLVPSSPFIVDIVNAKGEYASEVLAEQAEQKEQKSHFNRLTGAANSKNHQPSNDKNLAKDFGNLSLKSNGESSFNKPTNAPGVNHEDELVRNIVVHGVSLKRTPVNSTGAFIIETNRTAQARDFDVLISDPSNNLVDVQCYLQQDGNLLTEWIPRRIGPHKIEVLYKDRPVPNSPFTTQAFDPSGVIIGVPKTNEFSINDTIEVRIDRREAGEAELDIVLTDSSGEEQSIDIKPAADGRLGDIVTFKPTVGGKYKLSVTFSGYEVAKSPFAFTVLDSRETIKVSGSGLNSAEVNRSAHFTVEPPSDGELKLRIECGDREIVPKIERRGKIYMVKYKPNETGFAIVSIYWNGSHINGSPYSVPVNDLSKILFINPSTSGNKSAASGNEGGNQIAVDFEPRVAREITVDTSNCGPGHLKAESYCRANPNLKFSIPVIQLTTDRYKLVFTCPPEHEQLSKGVSLKDISLKATYILRFYYNNILVPEAQASVILSPHGTDKADESKPTGSAGDYKHNNNNNNNNNSNGISSKAKQIQPVEEPKAPSTSKAEATDDYANMDCDPLKVICTADSLKGGVLGEEIKTFIDTRKAGPGELTALCTGPQKVAFCELLDRGDGTFILYIKPQESGRHFLTVKYGGQHIPKSPFLIKVSGRPDPSKVRVYGPGVEHGVLSLYQSRFVCDTRGAGAGQLTVRIRGPKGAFRMETQRESQRDRTILCKYDPTEPGDYRIEIKWSGRQVPGSPFSVMIFDTQEELNRYLLSQQQREQLQPHPQMHHSGTHRAGKLPVDKLLPHHHNQIPFQQPGPDYGQYSHTLSMTPQAAAAASKSAQQQAPFRLK